MRRDVVGLLDEFLHFEMHRVIERNAPLEAERLKDRSDGATDAPLEPSSALRSMAMPNAWFGSDASTFRRRACADPAHSRRGLPQAQNKQPEQLEDRSDPTDFGNRAVRDHETPKRGADRDSEIGRR